MLNLTKFWRSLAIAGALTVAFACQEAPAEPTAAAEDGARSTPCVVAAPPSGEVASAAAPVRRAATTPCVDAEDHAAAVAHIDALLESIDAEGGE